MFNPTSDTLSAARRFGSGQLRCVRCVGDAHRNRRAARISARCADFDKRQLRRDWRGASGRGALERVVAVGATPQAEALLKPLLLPNEPLESGGHPAISSLLSVPIRGGDLFLGALYLCNKEGDDGFSAADEIIMRGEKHLAAILVEIGFRFDSVGRGSHSPEVVPETPRNRWQFEATRAATRAATPVSHGIIASFAGAIRRLVHGPI